jgi:hypothetical protein
MNLDSRSTLEFRREELQRQIVGSLHLLHGTLYRAPSQRGYHLSRHIHGQTVHKHVRKRLLPQVRAMVQNHWRVLELLDQLSEVNWRLLQLPPWDAFLDDDADL